MQIFKNVINDRGSKYSVSGLPVNSKEEVQLSISILKKEKKFAKASHNSWAIILSNEGPLKHDDGEAGAGALILKMLEQKELKNHLIIVTRWFGGINLGGDRFKNIKYCVNHFLKNYNDSN